ncbi:MAG TPA: HAMP domain-containing sensor histidine kinase [Terriglobales bacterium]|nr:HAMP domain-containing sensor histidine kinase [Terriglobales bacterium]
MRPPRAARRPWRRPPWWPADQPWPPPARRPPFFMWRFGCLLAIAVGFATVALSLVAWLVESATGAAQVGNRGIHAPQLAFLLLVAIAIAVAVRSVRRVVTPLRGLITAAGRVEEGDYSAHVSERGSSELRSVARAFNAMTARLRADDERRRSFLADVTHELRTPLAVIRGQAEAIADGLYPGDAEHLAPIIEAARTLEVLTEDLRTLALSEAGALALAREHVDLVALAHDAVAAFQARAGSVGISLAADAGEDVPAADIDPARIRSVLGNLLANALRHTPAGGTVRVAVRRSGDQVELSVADSGEGIPADLLPHVFERFVKGPGSTGSGLGLAIARDVVTAHGGTIGIESRQGAGTTVRLELPAARA